VAVNAFSTNDSNREHCRLELEREPTTSHYEHRRKKVEGITKTTLFFRRGAAAEAERQSREGDCEMRAALPSGDNTICKLVRGPDSWCLETVQGETFVRLEDGEKIDNLSKGMCFRFGEASVVTIERNGSEEVMTEPSSCYTSEAF
jgi:hypothetical protein